MRTNRKKWIALILCAAMIPALLPTASYAEKTWNVADPADEPAEETDVLYPEEAPQSAKEEPAFTVEPQAEQPEKDRESAGVVSALGGEAPDPGKVPADPVSLTHKETDKGDSPKDAVMDASQKSVYAGNMYLGLNLFQISAGDLTYRQFDVPTDGEYRFYSALEATDTIGYLYDANGNLIEYNDDGGYDLNFMIDVWLYAGNTYYLYAGYFGASSSGGYSVTAELTVNNDEYALRCGRNLVDIYDAGETVYTEFTPNVSGTYYIYSVSDKDTFGTREMSSRKVCQYDDDSGYGNNFEYSCDLDAGTAYYIGVRFFSRFETGSVSVVIEMRETDIDVSLGLNSFLIGTEGTTLYRRFTVPMTGFYRFLSASKYQVNGLTSQDNMIFLADSNMDVFMYDDDSGYGLYCGLDTVPMLTAGEVYYIGMRFYSQTQTGETPLLIEYPYEYADGLGIGTTYFTPPVAGSVVYYPFTPTASGEYTVYSAGSGDPFGTIMNSERVLILYDDDSASNNNFRFAVSLDAYETYYIGARFYSSATTGSIPVVIEFTGRAFDGTIEWNPNDVQFRGTTPYKVYNGSAHTPRFTVKDALGNAVSTASYTYEYRENVNAGTAYVIVHFTSGYSGSAYAWFKIYLPATATTKVENVDNGIRISWAAVTGATGYVIYRRAWSKTTGGWTSFERWNNTTELSWTDTNVYAGSRYQYGVKAYFSQRTDPVSGALIGGNVGDNYNLGQVGPLKTTVRITTRQLNSLKAGSKKITASWAGSSNFTGYELQHATNASFTQNAKTITISDPKTYSKVISSLKNGTMYYVRVRSYHVFEGMTYYGQWSNVLSVKPGSGQTVNYVKNRALLIGEVDYSGTGSNSRPGGFNDATSMAGMLQGLSDAFVTTSVKDATKSQIISNIRSTYSGATDDSISLFFFSGHGSTSGLYAVDGYTLTFSELASELNKIKGHVIVILSCCHSGASINKSAEAFDVDAWNKAAIEAFSEPNAPKYGELANSKYYVITAAPANNVSWSMLSGSFDGYGYPQSALTAAVIKGMACRYPNGSFLGGNMPADSNNDKKVTLKELYTYTYNTIYNWTVDFSSGGYSGPQLVQYYGPDSTILFRR